MSVSPGSNCPLSTFLLYFLRGINIKIGGYVGKKHFKIFMIGLIFIIAFLFLWMNRWKYMGASQIIRTDRISGKTEILTYDGWRAVEKKREAQETKKAEPDLKEFDKFLDRKGFIRIDNLPNDNEIREAAKKYNQKVAEIYRRKEKRFP